MTAEQITAALVAKGFTADEAEGLVKHYRSQQSEYSKAQDRLRVMEEERPNLEQWARYGYSVSGDYEAHKDDIAKLKESKSRVQSTPAGEVQNATGMTKKEVLEMMDAQLKEFGNRQSTAYTNLTKFISKASDTFRSKYNESFDLDAFDEFMTKNKITDPELAFERFTKPKEEAKSKADRETWEKTQRQEIEKELRSKLIHEGYQERPDTQGKTDSDKSNPWITDVEKRKTISDTAGRDEFMAALHGLPPTE